jgi:NAD(P)-dependent dehydrogenase (short-subunit alcohol dehydrogenase family)
MDAHSGKTAIVTGASSDIGRASAEALARAGFTVFGTSRRTTADRTSQVSMLRSEVTDDAAVNAVVSTVLSKTGRIDVLVNNAGIWAAGGAEESSVAQVQALFDVNLFGVMRMTNTALDRDSVLKDYEVRANIRALARDVMTTADPLRWWLTRWYWQRQLRARGAATLPARLRGRSACYTGSRLLFDKSLRKQMRLPA